MEECSIVPGRVHIIRVQSRNGEVEEHKPAACIRLECFLLLISSPFHLTIISIQQFLALAPQGGLTYVAITPVRH